MFDIDETVVEATCGKHEPVSCPSSSRSGGFRSVRSTYGSTPLNKTVIAVSATGLMAPPFFFMAAKRMSRRWWDPIKGIFNSPPSGIIARYKEKNWFSAARTVIKVSPNGSMEGLILVALVKHMDDFSRRVLRKDTAYDLILDGQASWKDIS